jgi:hypothetical protein
VPQLAPVLLRGPLTDESQVELLLTSLLVDEADKGYSELLSYNLYWEVGQVFVIRHTETNVESVVNYIETEVLQG